MASRWTIGGVARAVLIVGGVGVLGCAGACAGAWSAFFGGIYGPPAERAEPLVIRGGTAWDGTGTPATDDVVVVVEGERIACVGSTCTAPEGADVLDAGGLFVAPGLIDAHLHLGAPIGDDLDRSPAARVWDVLRHRPAARRSLLESGVTTVRSVGDDLGSTRKQQIWLADGTLGGPALHTAGPVFTAPGGHPAHVLLQSAPWLVEGSTRQVDDPGAAPPGCARCSTPGSRGSSSCTTTWTAGCRSSTGR